MRELVLTCEHGGNRVPARWAELFDGAEDLLASHRGWDPGALDLARHLSRALGAPLLFTQVTRLLVDANRSPGNPRVFSERTRALPRDERQGLLRLYHAPHWGRVEDEVRRLATTAPVVHVAVHSFTPVLDGRVRTTDVGLLYDPRRSSELRFSDRLHRALSEERSDLRIHRNAPYRGTADALPTHLRRLHPGRRYVGFELEVNQRFPLEGGRVWRAMKEALARALERALG